MGKIRKGNYIFLDWIGDHNPRHIHIYRDNAFIAKWDLDNKMVIDGSVGRQLRKHIDELESKGAFRK